MIRFRCSQCQKPLQVKDELAGKKVRCPQCKTVVVIPVAPTVKPAAAPVEPPPDIEALAAAAFSDEPATNGKQQAAATTIDFSCEYCETLIHAPLEEAGKRMQCPNPDCRSLIKVPTPKEEKPKDWRDLAKKGPTVAQMMKPEKIDEAA